MASPNRPLSPHLQIYKPQLTSVLSIMHRGTGIVLAIGMLFLVWWLVALASGEDVFVTAQKFWGSWIGRLLLLGWSYALFYHLANGLRHLFWDAGKGFELHEAYRNGWIVVAASVVMTLAAWLWGYSSMGSL